MSRNLVLLCGLVGIPWTVISPCHAAAPANVKAIPGNGMVTLVWQRVDTLKTTTYTIYRSTTQGGAGAKAIASSYHPAGSIPPVGSNPSQDDLHFLADFADKNVTNNTTYYYHISTNSESAKSTEVSATPRSASTDITKTRFLKIMPLGNSITLGWDGPNSMGGYRWPLIDSLTKANYNFLFVGSNTMQSDGMTDPYHEGYGNRTIQDLTYGVVNRAIPVYAPDIVMLEIGTNNFNTTWTSEEDIPTFLRAYDSLANKIYILKPDVFLILIPIPQWCFTQDQADIVAKTAKINQYNTGLGALAQGYVQQGKKALYMQNLEGIKTDASVGGDCLHPSHSEYVRMAGMLFTAIKGITVTASIVRSGAEHHSFSAPRIIAHDGGIVVSGNSAGVMEIRVFTPQGAVMRVKTNDAGFVTPIKLPPGAYVTEIVLRGMPAMRQTVLVR